ncbi:hypothetical protein [Pseudomonas sp. CC6-YY-74]|uniref:hypothetical protein n=1 Tax=Pseudomonas sp. CC6-YY-74 TaxID=1930532 RepID=UPI0012AC3428|nr:hypothetical protein [Pseudomonas sp. CC6-YY-74]
MKTLERLLERRTADVHQEMLERKGIVPSSLLTPAAKRPSALIRLCHSVAKAVEQIVNERHVL